MINLKEHFKLSAIYTIFAVFPALLQLIVLPLIEGESLLGATDFGYLAITEVIISLVFLICTFGMGGGVARFYYDYKDDKKGYNQLVSSVLNGILGRGLLIMGLVLVAGQFVGRLFPVAPLQDFHEYGHVLVIAGLNRSVIATLLVLYRNEKRLKAFIVVSLSSAIFRSGFQLGGVFLYDLSFIGYIYGTATGGALVSFSLAIYTYFTCGFHVNRTIIKAINQFAGPLFITEFLYWGLLFSDRFFLLNSPDQLGIYDNALKFAVGIQMILQGLTGAAQPEIFRYMKEGSIKRSSDIRTLCNLYIAEATVLITILILPVMVFISLFYETELTMSSGLVGIIFVRFILRAQYQIFSWPLLYRKKTILFIFINITVLGINLGINWLITPVMGYYGAITAFLIAYIVQIAGLKILQNRLAPVSYNNIKTFYFPMAIIFIAASLEIIKVAVSGEPFLYSSILVLVIFAGLFFIYKSELIKILSTLLPRLSNYLSGTNNNNTNDQVNGAR
jgi:O-antigen/teichoic acid export membrane protein